MRYQCWMSRSNQFAAPEILSDRVSLSSVCSRPGVSISLSNSPQSASAKARLCRRKSKPAILPDSESNPRSVFSVFHPSRCFPSYYFSCANFTGGGWTNAVQVKKVNNFSRVTVTYAGPAHIRRLFEIGLDDVAVIPVSALNGPKAVFEIQVLMRGGGKENDSGWFAY